MKSNPSIFISYSWQTKEVADEIALNLQLIGIAVVKDNQELNYTDSIPNFMKRIRSSDFALLLLSDSYLKSKNCLYEVLELQKDENHWDKVLPIVSEGTHIYNALDRLKYVQFWNQKTQELKKVLEVLNPIDTTESYKELKLFQNIAANIDEFIISVANSLHYTPAKLRESAYRPIIEKVGVDFDPTALTKLLAIAMIPDLENREIRLEEYSKEYPESTFYYSIKGGTSRDLKKFEQAIHYYEKGLNLDSSNYEILNNLGQIFQYYKQDYLKARESYEKAIVAKPDLAIPRLNLGVLLKAHFDDPEGAKFQYEEILKFDSDNPKAHNNLSNFYKHPNATEDELRKAENHLLKALEVDPDYIDALLSYGNFLKVHRKDYAKGNSYYERVRELDKEGNLSDLLDVLTSTNKG